MSSRSDPRVRERFSLGAAHGQRSARAAGGLRRFAERRPGSWLAPLAYQGTAGDARDLLSNVTSTVVTVIALVLGLTVVALQLSSTIP